MMGIGSLARFFKAEVMTSELEESSRLRYHSLWGRFVTFGITHGDSTVIMPASAETMQAWALELLMLGASPSLEQSAMSAVQSRHQDFGFEAPLRDNQLFCEGGFLPSRLAEDNFSTKQRPAEEDAGSERSDSSTESQCGSHGAGYAIVLQSGGPEAFSTMRYIQQEPRPHLQQTVLRKRCLSNLEPEAGYQAQGLLPRVLKASTGRLCTVWRMKKLIRKAGQTSLIACTKVCRPAARCPPCPPLFVSNKKNEGEHRHGELQPMSRQQISSAVFAEAHWGGCHSLLLNQHEERGDLCCHPREGARTHTGPAIWTRGWAFGTGLHASAGPSRTVRFSEGSTPLKKTETDHLRKLLDRSPGQWATPQRELWTGTEEFGPVLNIDEQVELWFRQGALITAQNRIAAKDHHSGSTGE